MNRRWISVYMDFFCIFGIQYMYGKSSSSSLVSIPNTVRTDLWLSSTSDAEKSVRLYVADQGKVIWWCNKPRRLQFQSILHDKYWCSQNATNQPKQAVELGYMCPRGLTGPPAVTLTQWLKYKKRLLLWCIRNFRSDLINHLEHMRISDTEPLSVILSQTKYK